jgi:uncharacterized protein YbjT (DUF2867 family)
MLLSYVEHVLIGCFMPAGENTLRSSGVPYTIVRPAGLSNAPGGQSELIIGQGDHPLKGRAQISRADVARVCVEALRYGVSD